MTPTLPYLLKKVLRVILVHRRFRRRKSPRISGGGEEPLLLLWASARDARAGSIARLQACWSACDASQDKPVPRTHLRTSHPVKIHAPSQPQPRKIEDETVEAQRQKRKGAYSNNIEDRKQNIGNNYKQKSTSSTNIRILPDRLRHLCVDLIRNLLLKHWQRLIKVIKTHRSKR